MDEDIGWEVVCEVNGIGEELVRAFEVLGISEVVGLLELVRGIEEEVTGLLVDVVSCSVVCGDDELGFWGEDWGPRVDVLIRGIKDDLGREDVVAPTVDVTAAVVDEAPGFVELGCE